MDGILDLCLNVVDGLVVYDKVITKHMMAELPFMATENIMMDAVKNGAVYQMPKAFEAWDSPVPSGVLGVLWTAKTLHPQTYGEAQYKDAAKMLYETYYGFTPDEAAL